MFTKQKAMVLIVATVLFSCATMKPPGSTEVSELYAILNARMGRMVIVMIPSRGNYELIDFVDEKMVLKDKNGKKVSEDQFGAGLMRRARYFLLSE